MASNYSTSMFKAMGVKPLDLSKFVPSPKAKEMLLRLFSNDSVRVLFCPLAEWGGCKSRPKLSGTMLISVDKTSLYPFAKAHGMVLRSLFDAGIVQVDLDTPAPDTRTVLFRLSDEALKDRRYIYRMLVLKGMRRVLMPELQALASAYGLAVEHQHLYRLFRIVKRDGTRLCKHDYVQYHPVTGVPVYRQSDLTMLEWDDIFYSYYLKYLANKK